MEDIKEVNVNVKVADAAAGGGCLLYSYLYCMGLTVAGL